METHEREMESLIYLAQLKANQAATDLIKIRLRLQVELAEIERSLNMGIAQAENALTLNSKCHLMRDANLDPGPYHLANASLQEVKLALHNLRYAATIGTTNWFYAQPESVQQQKL